jgi:hypothetical protein
VRNTNHETCHYEILCIHPVLQLGPNIILSTLFTNTLGLYYSLNSRDHISHPCRIYRKLIYSQLDIVFSILKMHLISSRCHTPRMPGPQLKKYKCSKLLAPELNACSGCRMLAFKLQDLTFPYIHFFFKHTSLSFYSCLTK